jgi:uncharacterized protein YcbK (DUF882 family)
MKMLLIAMGLSLSLSSVTVTEERELSFYHTHTGKKLSVVYFRSGEYLPDALREVNDYLKDFRNGEMHRIDPALLDVLFEIKQRTGTRVPFEVISAYRSPETNGMLRAKSTGVAEQSLHLRGQAIDVRLADVKLERLQQAALRLKRGGVGFYPESQFVHVDTGRVRYW